MVRWPASFGWKSGVGSSVCVSSPPLPSNAPRGQWPVRRVLEHVIWHEQVYVRMAAHMRGQPSPGDMPDYTPSTVSDAIEKLAESRRALLDGIEGVDEETFYRLGKMGFEEYSIVSMLENESNHEREHAAQIKKTLNNG